MSLELLMSFSTASIGRSMAYKVVVSSFPPAPRVNSATPRRYPFQSAPVDDPATVIGKARVQFASVLVRDAGGQRMFEVAASLSRLRRAEASSKEVLKADGFEAKLQQPKDSSRTIGWRPPPKGEHFGPLRVLVAGCATLHAGPRSPSLWLRIGTLR